MKLLLNLVLKDFKRNRVITTALAVFLILSALLLAGGLRVAGTMISSLNGLNELAMPPEYIQMHKGSYDEEAFINFVETHDYIKDGLIVKMLDISNVNIIYEGETLEKCLMDNGFVVQNVGFDFLLDLENEIAVVQDGNIGVPVYYAQEYGMQVGDAIIVRQGDYSKEFTISTIIRDSTMNSALTYSKRFLVSQSDLHEISKHMGEWEECFEFLLGDSSSTTVLEKDYMEASMPSNGVAVTGKLLNMLNAFSYGLIALIIVAISVLLMVIAGLCLSYIIRATMAEESYAIGEMKAIGFPGKAIERLYQIKYTILVLIAGLIGYLGAIPFGDFFSASVIQYCGYGKERWMQYIFPLMGIILLSLIVIFRCRRIICKNLKSTVLELMRGEEKRKKEGHYSLPSVGLKCSNLTIALGELKCKWKEYFVLFFVFVLSSFLILLPMNMKNTIENPSFLTYMGVGESDIRIDIQYSEKRIQQKDAAIDCLESDSEIASYAIYRSGYVQSRNVDGELEYIRVQSGEESVFPLKYLEGRAPEDGNEIALSYMNAAGLGKEVGDSMTVIYQGENSIFYVSGIYQDITYGGKTAKAMIDFREKDVEVYLIYLNVVEGVSIEEKTDELRHILTDSKITPVKEFVSQTFSGIKDNMSLVESAAIVISLLLVILITLLFLQLITAREHSAIAIKKAIGFTSRDIRIQFGIRILIIQVVGIMVGTILANTLGEAIFGVMLSTMGASKIKLLVDPVSSYLLWPIILMLVVFFTVIIGTGAVTNYHIRDQIME